MARRKTSQRSKAKTILRLPDLEQSKNAVLHSLAAASSQESYGHAIDELVVLQVSNADKFVAERLSCVLRLPNRKGCR